MFFFSPLWIFLHSWASNLARMEECRSIFKILTGEPARKRSLGRFRILKKYILIRGIALIRHRTEIIGDPLRMQH